MNGNLRLLPALGVATISSNTTSEANIHGIKMTSSPPFVHTPESFNYVVTHVFFPVKIPEKSDYTLENELSFAHAACAAAHAYSARVHAIEPQWHYVSNMLDGLKISAQSEQPHTKHIVRQLSGMQTGDIISLFFRSQNAGIVLTKQDDCTLFEPFEVSPSKCAVMETSASLICSYPWSVVEVSNEVFNDEDFQSELVSFFSRPSAIDSDLLPPPGHPQYITALLTGILRVVGRISDISHITKRIRDDTHQPTGSWSRSVWRRSSLWLFIRVAIQLSVNRSPPGRASYKRFMLFFICTIAKDTNSTALSNELLHLMSYKISRRLTKLGSSVPDWLSEMVLETYSRLREILDTRWRPLTTRRFSFRNPSQDELERDTQLSLLNSSEYIREALVRRDEKAYHTPFTPSPRRRGTIDDFLSSNAFFREAYDADPHVAIYDVEQSVEHGIDEWLASVTNIDEACGQLEVLMDEYMTKAHRRPERTEEPEDISIILLTGIELFVAMDKLALKEIPLLVYYSPEIPISLLESMLLRKTASLHRLSCAYQYLSMRHSQSYRGWSVLSNSFTEDSFSVRYYDQSEHLQRLKASIESDATGLLDSRSLLPSSTVHSKALVFELQCPGCIRSWRSAIARILYWSSFVKCGEDEELKMDGLLEHMPAFRPYFVKCNGPFLSIQIHLEYLYRGVSLHRSDRVFRYAIQTPKDGTTTIFPWDPQENYSCFKYSGYKKKSLPQYVDYVSHTPNDVLATQELCPEDMSLDEFIAFGNLRSGGSLQWINILQALRSRTLNLRHKDVHYLLAHTAFQVGPLDLDTGVWIWHQELQDPSFCIALLDELESILAEVGSVLIDGVMMSNISLLLARIFALSPTEDISGRGAMLLKIVRRITFNWVLELSYDLRMAPTNDERKELLQSMAATCRSTFDVDSTSLRRLFHSAEDVDAALSCAFFGNALLYECESDYEDQGLSLHRWPQSRAIPCDYTHLLIQRDRRLMHVLEETMRDVILIDPSDYGVDLAVANIFTKHRPSPLRWELLQYPCDHFFKCETKVVGDEPSQTVHLDLLHISLHKDNHPLGKLPSAIRHSKEFKRIFGERSVIVVPSDVSGMDFMAFASISKYKVYFALQGNNLRVQAHCRQTNHILELIPLNEIRGDLPLALIEDCVHWLNLSTKILEIRPLRQLWKQCTENWRIDCTSTHYRAFKGNETLVDMQSLTWLTISKSFEYFTKMNSPSGVLNDLLITVSPVHPLQSESVLRLFVAVPYYGLSFFVNEWEELQSCDFKDMAIDEDQCIGTLFGLENLLVFRPKHSVAKELVHRSILVPYGFFEERDHNIQFKGGYRSYHTYRVDTDLGCLVGNGSSLSILYLAYLHAMTSFHRPDPLTCRTGIEMAALYLQWSAGCWPATEEFSTCYNRHVDWHNPQITAAYMEAKQSKGWSMPGPMWQIAYSTDRPSLDRASRRAKYLMPLDAAKSVSQNCGRDMDYSFQASQPDLELEKVAFAAASAVHRWFTSVPSIDTISSWVELWSNTISPEYCPVPDSLLVKVREIMKRRKRTESQSLQLIFLLPTVAYCSPCHQAVFLSMLIAFAKQPQYYQHDLVHSHADYKISDGYRPTEGVLMCYIRDSRLTSKQVQYFDREGNEQENLRRDNGIIKYLVENWPSNTPSTISIDSHLWDVESLSIRLQPLFSSCYHNFNLKELLICVLTEPGLPAPPYLISVQQNIPYEHIPFQVTLGQLLSCRPTPKLPARATSLLCHIQMDPGDAKPSPDIPSLNKLFSTLKADCLFQQEYISQISASARCVHEEYRTTSRAVGGWMMDELEKYHTHCGNKYMDGLDSLKESLRPTSDPCDWLLDHLGLWPTVTGDILLRCIASTSPIRLSEQWKMCLVDFALLFLDLQRSRRLLQFALRNEEDEFRKELENKGCDGWNPKEFPDWLLIQIQGNFLIRRTQVEIAMKMIAPQSGKLKSAVMQVNMGEGKSSVIIPIIAAALSDGEQLVRVIVPKALMAQMFELLVSRLGGFANRPIYRLAFSRRAYGTEFGHHDIDSLYKLVSQCKEQRGILLVQPGHITSLKLAGVEKQIYGCKIVTDPSPNQRETMYKHLMMPMPFSFNLLSNDSVVGRIFKSLRRSSDPFSKGNTARINHNTEPSGNGHGVSDSASKWLNLLKWIHSNTRDILDECDEILHPRFQLIYTIGFGQHIDGYPDRWTITQQVLRLVKDHAYTISSIHPNSVEYEQGPPGSFPRIHFTQDRNVHKQLISLIVDDVMAGRHSSFNFHNLSPVLREAIRSFISDEDVLQVPDTVEIVEKYARQHHIRDGLLLLRGLLASNTLLFALAERRWRVDYGLCPEPKRRSRRKFGRSALSATSDTSTMLAVPYQAKDVPTPNTQFSHPDITIILTCLSYYYAGLSEKQLRKSFEVLLREDSPSAEYSNWVKAYDHGTLAPEKLCGINLRSSEQWDKVIYPLFSRNHVTIDFYLSRVVFPKEAKEFPRKLSASAWDLVEERDKPITGDRCFTSGFSGTSDGRWLLPMSIAQYDLDSQRGSNASVLACLLESKNDSYMVTHENGERWTSPQFLKMLTTQRPEIRVLLDVGAQVLDLSNREVAEAWLDVDSDAAGAIYFNEEDELVILTRNAIHQPMLSSPLSQQLNRCVFYLDHAHTRGTDIKFPTGARAAVTLGPKLTKDSLVQGCMRMRKLGRGHSVMFFAPFEVDQSIRALTGKNDPKDTVTATDILSWAIHGTWADIQHRAPYWAQQGMKHKSRYDAWTRFCNNGLTAEELSKVWLEPESKSLVDLYAPSQSKGAQDLSQLTPEIRQRCKYLGVLSLSNAQVDEEQEREVNREREREQELPPKAEPARHHLHPDVEAFVKTGLLPKLYSDSVFHPVFTTLEGTSAATHVEADVWSSLILATSDFYNTIEPESTVGTIDQYLRPVQWILSSKRESEQALVLISPFEANHLLANIRRSKYVHLHVYAPRTTSQMKSSDDLKLYTIPPLPSGWTPPWNRIDQLNIFAGQLYLRNHPTYLRQCRFLCISSEEPSNESPARWNSLNIPGSYEQIDVKFLDSPLPTVTALLSIRNRGKPFAHTHMGRILQGQILTEEDFEETPHDKSVRSKVMQRGKKIVTFRSHPPSPSDMNCDTPIAPGPPTHIASKRGPDMAEISDRSLEPPQKRLRSGL